MQRAWNHVYYRGKIKRTAVLPNPILSQQALCNRMQDPLWCFNSEGFDSSPDPDAELKGDCQTA